MTMLTRTFNQQNHPFMNGLLACGAVFCILATLSTSASSALTQAVAATPLLAQPSATLPNTRKDTSATVSSVPKIASRPAWKELTTAQQMSLQPLAANWNTLGDAQKRKWIALAVNYPNLAPGEQAKLHSRMTEWVSLSQQQRAQARLNFAQSKQLAPPDKTATWRAYQALSPEDKKKLALSATPKPAGAAAAAKPVPPEKLTAVPMTRQTPTQTPRVSATIHAVNRNTLLPHSPPLVEPAPTQKN